MLVYTVKLTIIRLAAFKLRHQNEHSNYIACLPIRLTIIKTIQLQVVSMHT